MRNYNRTELLAALSDAKGYAVLRNRILQHLWMGHRTIRWGLGVDIFQDAVLAYLKAAGRYEERANHGNIFIAICYQRAVDRIRQMSAEERRIALHFNAFPTGKHPLEVGASSDPTAELESLEVNDVLKQEIERMTPYYRNAMEALMASSSYEEAVSVSGIKLNTLKPAIHRARQILIRRARIRMLLEAYGIPMPS